MKPLFTGLLTILSLVLAGQAKLVINGGIISLANGAALIIDNPDNTAISRSGSGYILSESASNRLIWNIGSGNGNTYLIPFGNTSNYLPLSFTAAYGSTNGSIIFSTYPTPTWKNSDYLPPGVTNVNGSGGDNSAKLIDRFWQIRPQGYITKPTLSNLIFTYSDFEYNAPNSITETNLILQRWNNSLLSWSDYFPSSVINTSSNTIGIATIPGSQLFDWWTMDDLTSPLPVTLVYFNAIAVDKKVVANWQTASENNTSHFEVWRSKDLQQFDSVGIHVAAGNSSNMLNYSLTDTHPYYGISYYRLKTVDLNGGFKWSAVEKVMISDDSYMSLYPNPAEGYINIIVNSKIANKKPVALMYDAKGNLVQSFTISGTIQQVNIASLPAGTYFIHFTYNDNPHTLFFIKK